MLIAIRHGESQANAKVDGVKWDYANYLTHNGIEQAIECGKRLDGMNLNRPSVHTSPLPRAYHTALTLCSMCGITRPLTVSHSLKEMAFQADMSYIRGDDIKNTFGDDIFERISKDLDARPMPDGESKRDLYNRVESYYSKTLLPESKRRDVVVVAHYFVIRALKFASNGVGASGMVSDDSFHPQNAQAYVIIE